MLKRAALMIALMNVARMAQGDATRIPIPNMGIQVRVVLPGLGYATDSKMDGGYIYAAQAGRITFSCQVERLDKPSRTHRQVKDHYWEGKDEIPMLDKTSVKLLDAPRFMRVDYGFNLSIAGKNHLQQYRSYYIALKGAWIKLDLTVTDPTKDDYAVFAKFDQGLLVE
jgi:hypothetical protein